MNLKYDTAEFIKIQIFKYMAVEIVRHGPKNNNAEAHLTGVEASLDPTKMGEIRVFARNFVSRVPKGLIRIDSTPVDRAVATTLVIYQTIVNEGLSSLIQEPKVDSLIGSYEIGLDGKVINLSPAAMSKIWGNAKKEESYAYLQGENKPLFAWSEQGFFNPQSENPIDPGISLAEIGWRIGTYVYSKHNEIIEKGLTKNTLAIGHSGDIEPWLYLTLAMEEGKDITQNVVMADYFRRTGGALEPLTGVRIVHDQRNKCFILTYLEGEILREDIKKNKISHTYTKAVKLPSLIINPEDV
ncbi:MAG: hypothetical protein M1365_01750 [Actinobacteria bacterium]|nr:hypothetical protein [Actinomycetota bacterium]